MVVFGHLLGKGIIVQLVRHFALCPEETGLLHFVNLHRHYPPPHVPLSSLGSLLGRWSGCRRTIRNHPTPSRRGHRICCPASIPAQCPREPSTHHLRHGPMKWMRDSEALRIQISNYIICMLSTFLYNRHLVIHVNIYIYNIYIYINTYQYILIHINTY